MQVNKIKSKRKAAIFVTILAIIIVTSVFTTNMTLAVKPAAPAFLDPKTIPKYVNQLVVPPVYIPDAGTTTAYTVSMEEGRQQILPNGTPLVAGSDGKTTVWGYKGNAVAKGTTLGVADGTQLPAFFHSPSATFETIKGTPINVKWINGITGSHLFAVDPTLYWANPTGAFPEGDIFSATGGPFPAFPPGFIGQRTGLNNLPLNAQTPVPLAPHLHGSEVAPQFDGGPEGWWTASGIRGPHYNSVTPTDANASIYQYANAQEPNTLWYHDHALGITRINVMSGLAGYYLLRNPTTNTPITTLTAANFDEYLTRNFPYGVSEIPIAIQDRIFQTNGEIFFPSVGLNPTIHPYWNPEFFGDTIMVNGRVWPNLDVTPGWYRFRLLDGSNARFYTLSFDNKMPFTVIGEDGGYLQSPVVMNTITMAPGERADILIQFTPAMVGSKIILTNSAKAPFPNGAKADPQTTGQIMQFTVLPIGDPAAETSGVQSMLALPPNLNPTLPAGAFPTLPATTLPRRLITLNEVMGPAGPVMVMINGQYYNAPVTETPKVGSIEEWVIINLTADTHPIHTHLVTFQLVSRQAFQSAKYTTDWLKKQLDPVTNTLVAPPFPRWYNPQSNPLDPTPYLQGKPVLPTPAEMTWKDTLQMHPGEITVIRIQFTQQNGQPFPFDATGSPGYVYHCHIIDHEDNEMMRPFTVAP